MSNFATLLAVFFLIGVISAKSCNLPPSEWCSTTEISVACQVEKQCRLWSGMGSKATAPVNIALYYESLCPGCKEFITTQLQPTWMKLGDSGILNVTLVPYGNAHEQQEGTGWIFECQHGEWECAGNIMETCILSLFKFKTAAPIIFCMEAAVDPYRTAYQCLQQQGVDPKPALQCANSSMGNALEHKMALLTESLNPPHQYTPWITLNGMHTEAIQQKATTDLAKLVCDTFTGQKPDACSDLYNMERCYRNSKSTFT
ncbi:gamma-interferon-inducible lysosomal thiol reductase-like isoform X1 [Anneissia japonica]|uniref:gamma-interferon-inducible lysosomal thiol reductase-like isoform X1 n=1 Tax=Anneissia japonica TaxID=1529436 RepID=UPI001425857C|nr:gamma-interferon-inducible lysosomal thiol reductase-like isoform X1 [Anneissia japonica]